MSILMLYGEIIAKRVRDEWSKITTIPGDAESGVDPLDIAIGIGVTIWGKDWKAWIAEYGSGSLLDRENPWLDEYIEMNPDRPGRNYAFLGRTSGDTVYVPGGDPYESSGRAKGANLEKGLKNPTKYPPYKPQPPLHIIRDQIALALPEIDEALIEAMESTLYSTVMRVTPKEIRL